MPHERTIPKTCQQCGKPFLAYRENLKYCSNACKHVSKVNRVTVSCAHCGKAFLVCPSTVKIGKGRFCSRACADLHRAPAGPKSHRWKGGKSITARGYVVVNLSRGKTVFEHRLVMEQQLGRPLLPTEDVHHLNGNTQDNRPENLQLMGHGEHRRLHAALRRAGR